MVTLVVINLESSLSLSEIFVPTLTHTRKNRKAKEEC
jgi:hypothetical protein